MLLKIPLYKTILLCILLMPLFTMAQTFSFQQYTTRDGLPIDNVYAAAQDDQGFIWFGTDFGIARYDGYHFKTYSKNEGMANKAVTDIVYAGGDSMIFNSYPQVLQTIHTNGKINTVVPNSIIALQQLIRHNNAFYCYSRDAVNFGLLIDGKYKVLFADSVFNEKGLIIHAIFSLDEKGVGFCTNKGLFVKNDMLTTCLLPGQDVRFAVYTKEKKITAVSNNKVVTSDGQFNFQQSAFSFSANFVLYHMVMETNGTMWFRGLDKGVYRLKDNNLEEMSSRLGLQNKAINEFFTDAQGNLWFCTDGSGILFKRRSFFQNFETQDGLVNNKVLKLLKQQGNLFIGTSNGLSVKKGNRIISIDLPSNSDQLKYVFRLFPLSDGSTGICYTNNLAFSKDTAKEISLIQKLQVRGFSLKLFNALFGWEQAPGDFWLLQSTRNLLHINERDKKKELYKLAELGVKKIYAMAKYDNTIWVGFNKGMVLIDKNTIIKKDSIGNEKLGQVFDFLIDKKNRLWIATESGLFLYYNKQYTVIKKGLSLGSNYCVAITEDDEGKIWCATWDGIFVTDGIEKKYYNTSEGLMSKTANCILYDAITRQIYVGTDNGLTVCDKQGLAVTNLYNAVFINCSISDSGKIEDGTHLETDQHNLNFYLSIPCYEGSEAISFEYKIDNGTWTAALNPSIFIRDISSGKHQFYARAKLNGQLFTKEDAVFTFSIDTPFYKNWWFWILPVLLFQFIIFRIINQYNKRSKERKMATQQQQADYASLKQQAFTLMMNPHFIFNALNSVQFYVNKQDRQSANKYLSDFATLIRRSFDAAQRSFVTLDEELETIRLYLQLEKMRFVDKFEYVINVSREAEDDEWMLPSMMLQPFMENAVLHGLMPLQEKGFLSIDATVQQNSLCIIITDNGIGIEKSKALRRGAKHNSKGMQLIKERIGLLSKLGKEPIQLIITDLNPGTENPGTKITMVIPQEIFEAYQKQINPQ